MPSSHIRYLQQMSSAAYCNYLVNGDLVFVSYRGAGALTRWTLVKGQQQRCAQKTIESLGKELQDASGEKIQGGLASVFHWIGDKAYSDRFADDRQATAPRWWGSQAPLCSI